MTHHNHSNHHPFEGLSTTHFRYGARTQPIQRAVTPEIARFEPSHVMQAPARPSSAASFEPSASIDKPILHQPKPLKWSNTPNNSFFSHTNVKAVHAQGLRVQTASVGAVSPAPESEDEHLRSRSMSPSLFGQAPPSHTHSGPSAVPGTCVLRGNGQRDRESTKKKQPTSLEKRKPRKDDKKKHGSFKIWHRNASYELQEAYNAIYGLPLYGSVTFVGQKVDHCDFTIPEPKPGQEGEETEAGERVERVFDDIVCTNIVKRFGGPSEHVLMLPNGAQVKLESAGKDDGDYARIVVDGQEMCQDKRGFNMVSISPMGEIESSCFDTHGLPEEAERLAEFVSNAELGTLFLGCVRDDGAKFLGAMGRRALTSVGVSIPAADDADRLEQVVEGLPAERTKVLLTVCSKANSARCARVLLRNGWDIETRASHTMNTPLHDAIYQRNTDVAIVLLDAGADPFLENKWGETPSDIASKKFGFNSLEDMIMQNDTGIQSVVRFIGIDGL